MSQHLLEVGSDEGCGLVRLTNSQEQKGALRKGHWKRGIAKGALTWRSSGGVVVLPLEAHAGLGLERQLLRGWRL
eukprot:1438984-Rhodomonas_salina.1